MQGCVGKDRIERLAKGKIPRIADGKRQGSGNCSRAASTILSDKSMPTTSAPGRGNLGTQFASAAAQVEDALTGLRDPKPPPSRHPQR